MQIPQRSENQRSERAGWARDGPFLPRTYARSLADPICSFVRLGYCHREGGGVEWGHACTPSRAPRASFTSPKTSTKTACKTNNKQGPATNQQDHLGLAGLLEERTVGVTQCGFMPQCAAFGFAARAPSALPSGLRKALRLVRPRDERWCSKYLLRERLAGCRRLDEYHVVQNADNAPIGVDGLYRGARGEEMRA
jgi:hypothetical protein